MYNKISDSIKYDEANFMKAKVKSPCYIEVINSVGICAGENMRGNDFCTAGLSLDQGSATSGP